MSDDRFYMDDPYPTLQKSDKVEFKNKKKQIGELRNFSRKQKLQGYPVFDRQTLIENVAGNGRDMLGFSDDIDEMAQPRAIQSQMRSAATMQGRRKAGGGSIHQPRVISSTHASQMKVKKTKTPKVRSPKLYDRDDDFYYNGMKNKRTDDIQWDNSRAEWPTQMLYTSQPYNSGLDAKCAAMASGKIDMNTSRAVQDPRHQGQPMQKSQGGKKQQAQSTTSTDDYIAKHFDRITGGGNLSSKAGTDLVEDKVNW